MQQPFFPSEQIFTVSQITELIKGILENSFRTITIEGEISNWKPSSAGHIYFTLKDNSAQIKAVIFRGNAYHLSFRPKDGDKVRCTGSISVYAPQGSYQLIVTKIEPAGTGNILQMLEERKRKLAEEGLFDENRKKMIPSYPETIGVITSPTGAAIKDILQIAKRRNNCVNIKILPAIVQGEEAAGTIVKMIEIANFYKLCDVLIVGRGGGSLEDLLPFSEEAVVRAVAGSEIPVISAVGHEIDWALCDYAADKRAATPSAAAEIAIPLKTNVQQQLSTYKLEYYKQLKQKIDYDRLLVRSFRPDSFEIRFRNLQQPLLNRYANAKDNLVKNIEEKIKNLQNKITQNVTILENASPKTILKKGYSMVTDKNGNIIRDSSQVLSGDILEIIPANGKIKAKAL